MLSRNDGPGIGLRALIFYGLPGLPLAAVTLPLYIHIPNFYAVDLGLGLAAVGLIVLAMRLWDVVTDPLVGLLSDRVGGRFGRRRLWIAIGLPVAVLGGWLLFRPPDDAGLTYLLIAGLVLHLGWTLVMLPYQAWGAELTGDYHQRNRITAWREGFVVIGTLIAGGLVAAAGSPATRADALATVGLVLAIGLPLAVAPALLFLPDPIVPRRAAVIGRREWRDGLRRLSRNKPFVRLLLAWILNGIANGLPATLFLLYVGTVLGQPEKSGIFLSTYFLVAIAGLPIWLRVAGRFGKHRAWCAAMIWACAWFALAPFLGPGDSLAYMALCIGTGLALGADLALPPSMQADVVDVDTAEGGPAKTGVYFALWGMATKLALALAVGIAFPMLEAFGLETDSPATGGEGALVLALLYGAVPIAFKLSAIALMWRFPLNAETQVALRARIEGSVE